MCIRVFYKRQMDRKEKKKELYKIFDKILNFNLILGDEKRIQNLSENEAYKIIFTKYLKITENF